MLKYLQRVWDRTDKQKSGISNNPADWATSPDTPATKQTDLDAIKKADDNVTDAQTKLTQMLAEARLVASAKRKNADDTDDRVRGTYAGNTGKFPEFGLPIPADPQTRPVPGKAVIISIVEDEDGEGFVITTKSDPNGDFLEIEIGNAAADVLVLAPPFPVVKTSKKLKYVDNDTVSGRRYFYRVRHVNNSGHGEWSDTGVSGVQ